MASQRAHSIRIASADRVVTSSGGEQPEPGPIEASLAQHTSLTLEFVDQMYLNVYVPPFQRGADAACSFRGERGAQVPSSVLMASMTRRFVVAIKRLRAATSDRHRPVLARRAQGRSNPRACTPSPPVR